MRFFYLTDQRKVKRAINYIKGSSGYLFLDTEVYIQNIRRQDYKNDKIRLIQIGDGKDIFLFVKM